MEVYAGFLEHTDHHIGRLVDALDDLGVLGHARLLHHRRQRCLGGGHGQRDVQRDVHLQRRGSARDAGVVASRIDEFGTATAYNHYAVGWAHAMDTPYQWTKQVASHWGGTRNGTIVHWPGGFSARGEVRSQFHGVIDVAPTVLEAAGLPHPTTVDGVQQHPIEGTSMRYSFDGAGEADRHDTQYFEMFCNRGIYHQGWTTVTRHSIPWLVGAELPAFEDDVWELYEPDDWSQARDLAVEMPEKLAELQQGLARGGAGSTTFFRSTTAASRGSMPTSSADPVLVKGNSQLLFGGMGRLSENSILNIKNKSHAVTTAVIVPHGGGEGVIIAQGGAFAGWSLYAKERRPTYCYTCSDSSASRFQVTHRSLPAISGRMEFAYDGGGSPKVARSPSMSTATRLAKGGSRARCR